MSLTTVRLPSDNRLVDDGGRILPPWRNLLEKLAPLSKLSAAELNTLISLAQAVTETNPALGEPFLGDDGELNIASAQTTYFDFYNQGEFITTQEATGRDAPFLLMGRNGVQVGEESSIGGVRIDADAPVMAIAGTYLTALTYGGNSASGNALIADTIYASPFYVNAPWAVGSFGPVKRNAGTNSAGYRLSIYSNAIIGGRFYPYRQIHTEAGNIGGSGVVGVGGVTLAPGVYWVLFVVDDASTAVVPQYSVPSSVNNATLAGGVLSGTNVSPVQGLTRSTSANAMADDESTQSWSASFGANFPTMIL